MRAREGCGKRSEGEEVGDEADTLGIRRGRRGGGRAIASRRQAGEGGRLAFAYGGREGSVACCLRAYMWLPVPRDVDGGLVTRHSR